MSLISNYGDEKQVTILVNNVDNDKSRKIGYLFVSKFNRIHQILRYPTTSTKNELHHSFKENK